MSVFPPGDTWTGEQATLAIRTVTYPLEIISFIINLAGVTAFYWFKKHRKFPISVLAWIGVVNTCYSAFMIAKWAPGSSSSYALLNAPNVALCGFSLWADIFNFYCLVALNTLISLTLYLTICRRKDLDYSQNPMYFWIYISFFWIVVSIAPLVISTLPTTLFDGAGVCKPDYVTSQAEYVPVYLMILAQIFFVAKAVAQARGIIANARSINHSKHDLRLAYMLVRFCATIMSELLALIPYYISLFSNETPTILKVVAICIPLASIIDGLILLIGNRPLLRKVLRKVFLMSDENSTSDSNSDRSKQVRMSNLSKSTRSVAEPGSQPTNSASV